jgi:hypothetical protein
MLDEPCRGNVISETPPPVPLFLLFQFLRIAVRVILRGACAKKWWLVTCSLIYTGIRVRTITAPKGSLAASWSQHHHALSCPFLGAAAGYTFFGPVGNGDWHSPFRILGGSALGGSLLAQLRAVCNIAIWSH